MKLQVHLTGHQAVRDQLQRIGAQPVQALNQTIEDLEEYVQGEVAKHRGKPREGYTPGALNRSIYKRRIADGWELGHDLQVARHALWVHWGARPHVIYPKGANLDTQRELFGKNGTQRTLTAAGKLKPMPGGRKLVLRWAFGGRFIFAQKVNHPGNKPDPWLARAAALAPSIFARHVQALIAKEASNATA